MEFLLNPQINRVTEFSYNLLKFFQNFINFALNYVKIISILSSEFLKPVRVSMADAKGNSMAMKYTSLRY